MDPGEGQKKLDFMVGTFDNLAKKYGASYMDLASTGVRAGRMITTHASHASWTEPHTQNTALSGLVRFHRVLTRTVGAQGSLVCILSQCAKSLSLCLPRTHDE